MHTSIYAALLTLLIIHLAMKVIRLRRHHKVSVGDGGLEDLQLAIRTHANAVEYIPITLLLLFLLEYQDGHWLLIHLAGIAVVVGRILHARALPSINFKSRILGMQLSFITLIALASLNLIYYVLFFFPHL